ncbi:MAG: hypothetical protein EOP45_00250 [Sphingobacteriaceae bacterium]|nr:MAG: hypothetical protein EOP45_00250 [Sphingobacteriaceae bacterium]
MSYHRIDKYSRQVVCQDMVLSCQLENIKEIPLFKRARINKLSLRNREIASSGELFSARNLDLSGMLINWHLWNQRGASLFSQRKSVSQERERGTTSEKGKAVCESLLTLRKKVLSMAIEKYLLFLMSRDMKSKRLVEPQNHLLSRRKRVDLSALYVDTAFGLRQCDFLSKKMQEVVPLAQWKVLSPERIHLPHVEVNYTPIDIYVPRVSSLYFKQECASQLFFFPHLNKLCLFPQEKVHIKDSALHLRSGLKKDSCRHNKIFPRIATKRRLFRSQPLSLYCPSVLNSPDVQDIAQSGLATLEGSFVLELS